MSRPLTQTLTQTALTLTYGPADVPLPPTTTTQAPNPKAVTRTLSAGLVECGHGLRLRRIELRLGAKPATSAAPGEAAFGTPHLAQRSPTCQTAWFWVLCLSRVLGGEWVAVAAMYQREAVLTQPGQYPLQVSRGMPHRLQG